MSVIIIIIGSSCLRHAIVNMRYHYAKIRESINMRRRTERDMRDETLYILKMPIKHAIRRYYRLTCHHAPSSFTLFGRRHACYYYTRLPHAPHAANTIMPPPPKDYAAMTVPPRNMLRLSLAPKMRVTRCKRYITTCRCLSPLMQERARKYSHYLRRLLVATIIMPRTLRFTPRHCFIVIR